MKALSRTLITSATLVSLMGASVPAYASTSAPEQNDDCVTVGYETEHLADQVCAAMAKANTELNLGAPVTTSSSVSTAQTTVYRLSTYVFSQQFENGWIIYSMDTGHTAAVSNEVYSFWAQSSLVTFDEMVANYGMPETTVSSLTNRAVHQGEGLTTVFRRADGKLTYLQYVPSVGVMDFTADYEGDPVSWNNSIMLGEMPGVMHADTTHIASGLESAGYTPIAVGPNQSRLTGGADAGNLAAALGAHTIALPAGTPWVVNISLSASDATLDRANTESVLRASIEQLQQAYPHSRIVVNSVLTSESEEDLNAFNAQMGAAARSEGARFVDTSGWISKYELQSHVLSDGHSLDQAGQTRVNYFMKWAIRQAIDPHEVPAG